MGAKTPVRRLMDILKKEQSERSDILAPASLLFPLFDLLRIPITLFKFILPFSFPRSMSNGLESLGAGVSHHPMEAIIKEEEEEECIIFSEGAVGSDDDDSYDESLNSTVSTVNESIIRHDDDDNDDNDEDDEDDEEEDSIEFFCQSSCTSSPSTPDQVQHGGSVFVDTEIEEVDGDEDEDEDVFFFCTEEETTPHRTRESDGFSSMPTPILCQRGQKSDTKNEAMHRSHHHQKEVIEEFIVECMRWRRCMKMCVDSFKQWKYVMMKVQKMWKRRYTQHGKCATKVQSVWKMYTVRRMISVSHAAAKNIQSIWKVRHKRSADEENIQTHS
jgi:hypothetical protein